MRRAVTLNYFTNLTNKLKEEMKWNTYQKTQRIWVRWNDKDLAIELAKKYDNKENGMNEAYDNIIRLLEEMKNTR